MANIAVVNDAFSLDSVTDLLEDQGHSVLVCEKGADLENKILHFSPHLILFDITYADYKILRSIKHSESIKDVPIILISSKDGSNNFEWGLRQGAVSYISQLTPMSITSTIKPYLPSK